METIIITAVLAFLLGMAVGIAGYCFTTLVAWENEIEDIFERMCHKYEAKLKAYREENDRLHGICIRCKRDNPNCNCSEECVMLAERKVRG